MILNLKVELELEVKFKLAIYVIYAISLLKSASRRLLCCYFVCTANVRSVSHS